MNETKNMSTIRKIYKQISDFADMHTWSVFVPILSEFVDLGLKFYSIENVECIEGNTKLDESIL